MEKKENCVVGRWEILYEAGSRWKPLEYFGRIKKNVTERARTGHRTLEGIHSKHLECKTTFWIHFYSLLRFKVCDLSPI